MKERFSGTQGKRLLIDALKAHDIIKYNEGCATALAEKGMLIEYGVGSTIISQGATDNDIFFLLDGKVEVYVHDRCVAVRGAHDTIGEMALLEPTAKRSATIKVIESVVAFKVSEPDFQVVAENFSHIWHNIAVTVARKLRQREKFHDCPNETPVLFLGSSAESLPIGREMQVGLQHDPFITRLWTGGVFGPSGTTIDSLLGQVSQADFAAFILGADDKVFSRDTESQAPRDNVIFELGLFMGKLGRERTFIIHEHGKDLKIPTDILGITPITYIVKNNDVSSALAPVCVKISNVIKDLGSK